MRGPVSVAGGGWSLVVGTVMERPSGTAVRAALGDAPVVVGRTREQVYLREELAAAIGGHGRLILLGGEAGIGKTTLARDLARQAREREVCVLVGHCYDLTNTPPYGPWVDLVAGYEAGDTLPPPPAAFAGGTLKDFTSQAALFADVRRFLADLAAARPTVVVLEDLHWADPASLELLRHVAPQVGAWPLLLLVTYRVDELTRHHPFYQQIPALVREADGLRLDLRRLDTGALRTLVADRYHLPTPDQTRLVGYLEQHAEGNPFFTTELLRALQEQTLLQPIGETWELRELNRVVMPSLLRQVIDGRVARLGEETRKPLAIAAVIGQDVPLDLWAEVAELGDEALLAIVEQAVEAHLLEAERDGTRVRFVHALTREALYEGVLPPRRRVWHREVAEALAAGASADPDAIAFHFQQASDSRAPDWLIRAGERAQRAYAWLTAVDRLQTAAELLAGVAGQERTRGWLLLRLARLRRLSSPAEGAEALEEAERLGEIVGDEYLRADARHSRGILLCYADDYAGGVRFMEEGVVLLEARPGAADGAPGPAELWLADALPAALPNEGFDDDGEAVLAAKGIHFRRLSLPWFSAVAGHLERSVRTGESFIAAIEPVEHLGGLIRSSIGHTSQGLGNAYAGLGRPDDARRAFAQARETYRVLDHHGVIAFSLLTELRDVVIPYLADQPAERRRLAAEAEAALRRAGGALFPGIPPRLGWLSCLTLDGDWDEALRIAAETPPPHNTYLRREITATRALLAHHRGDTALARAQIAAVLPDGPAMAPGSRIHQEALFLQRLAADLCLDAGDLDGARAWLEAHDRWLAWSGAVLGRAEGRLAWARYHLAEGDTAPAGSALAEATALANGPRQPLVLLASHRLCGQIATERGSTKAADHHLALALDLADACAAPFERARTLLTLADLRFRTGERAAAEALLTETRRLCLPLGAAPTLAAVDALASQFGAPATTGSLPFGLTQREAEVLRLVAEGLTDAAVADRLYISPRTVSQHLRSVYAKIGVSSRSAATRLAMENGLA
jgi:DNA-binding CsgD family transcriptional regulator